MLDINLKVKKYGIAISYLVIVFIAILAQTWIVIIIVLFLSLVAGFWVTQKIFQSNAELTDLAKNLPKKLNKNDDRNRIRAILSSMIEGIIAIDKSEKIILFNSAIKEMLNIGNTVVIGKLFWEVVRNNEIHSILTEAMNKKTLQKKEITLYYPTEKILQIHALPIKDEEDNVSGAVAVLHDITELKKLEKMRIEFVANVSHELRTPLTSIQGFIETLKEGAIDDKLNNRRFLSIIERHTQRLNHLINDIIELSHIESGFIKMKFQSINIKEIIDTVIFNFQEAIEKKNHTVLVNLSDTLPPIKADAKKMEQVFNNLIDNAIKHTAQGGNISFNADLKDETIRIAVSDTGEGIPEENISRVFERFYRIDNSRSREEGGAGLGLSIVKHIILAHGGTVSVQSKLNKGSTFFITLPLSHS